MSYLTVSVVIPLFNNARFVAEAVHSVLDQTYPVHEVLVIDDGSDDGSVAAVPVHEKVKVITRPHEGIAPTLNFGVTQATGEVLAFLDSDDRWLPTKLERQLARLESSKAREIIFCQTRIFHGNQPVAENAEVVNAVAKPAMLLRRTDFELIGQFPTGEGAHDFLGWYARSLEVGLATHVIPEVLFERRVHDQNDGLLKREQQRTNYFETLKTMLDRRRKIQAEK